MGFLDRFRDSDGYADVDKGRTEEVNREDWQTELNMRSYYKSQDSKDPDCPSEDCNHGDVIPHDAEPSRSVSDTAEASASAGAGIKTGRQSEASRGNPEVVYSCDNPYDCENKITKVEKMQEKMAAGEAPSDIEADEKFKSSSEEMSQESQNASEFKSGDEEIEPPSNTETQN